jgi:polyisoprenoid-binding protein YceI
MQNRVYTAHSSVGFKVRHFFAKATGNFRQFEGTIQFDPAQPERASVEATIQTTSIDTANEGRDKHLRSADFFDVEKFPTLTFKSTKVEKKGEELLVTGDLTIKGVTKSVTFPIEFHGAGPTPWGAQSAGFSAELKIDRKDFGVTWNKALDQGGTVLGDDVAISLEIEALEAKEGQSR